MTWDVLAAEGDRRWLVRDGDRTAIGDWPSRQLEVLIVGPESALGHGQWRDPTPEDIANFARVSSALTVIEPQPALTAAFDPDKHPRDERGQFTGDGGALPDGWQQMSKDESRDHQTDRIVSATGLSRGDASKLAEAFVPSRVHAIYAGPNGMTVTIIRKMDADDQRKAIDVASDLQEKFPRENMTIRVDSKAIDVLFDRYGQATVDALPLTQTKAANTYGATISGSNVMTLSPALFNDANIERIKASTESGHFMPAETEDPVAFVMAHEWGHTYNENPVNVTLDAVDKEHLSPGSWYGESSPFEAYAESFAEWYVSEGGTDDQFTRYLAKREGWPNAEALAASARCTFEFREEDHPREHGRFVEKDGGGDGGEKPHVSLREPGQKLTKPMVMSRANKIAKDVADFYGSDKVAKVEVDEYGVMQGGYAGVRNLDLTGRGREEVILVNPALVENLKEADSGIRDFRVVAHEAVHASVGGPDAVLPGFSKTYEEGGAEILSIHYWKERGQPMGPDDAFRRQDRQEGESRWTDPGNETLAASVVYRDEVTELMTRAASAAGEWDRQAVLDQVEQVMRGGHYDRMQFRDATDPEFPPPEGVGRDAESLIRWLIEDDKALTAAGDFEEEAHPRGPDGRFLSKDASGESTDGDKRDLDAKVMGLLGVPVGAEATMDTYESPTAQAAKREVAQMLATNMKSSTEDLVNATGGRGVLGNDIMYLGRNTDGKIWALNGSELPGTLHGVVSGEVISYAGTKFTDVTRGDQPGAEAMVREQAAGRLIDIWSITAGDSDPQATAIQEVARREFGLDNAADWQPDARLLAEWEQTPEDFAHEVSVHVDANGDVYADYLRTQYDATQAALADAGITELPLARGFTWHDDDGNPVEPPAWARPGESDVPLRPMSSWSYDRHVAETFAGGEGYTGASTVVTATIPAERILSFPRTGMGSLSEQEFVVLGGPVHATIEHTDEALTRSEVQALAAAGDWDPDEHPKGPDGRFVEKDGGGDPVTEARSLTLDLLDDYRDSRWAVVRNAASRGESLLGLESLKAADSDPVVSMPKVPQSMAAEAKAEVSADLARDMKSSTADLFAAAGFAGETHFGVKAEDVIGNPEMVVWRDLRGHVLWDRADQHLQLPGETHLRGDTPEAEQMMRELATSKLVHQWAVTANDDYDLSLAIQEAAIQEFGLNDTAPWSETSSGTQRDTDALLAEHGDVYRDFLRTQYEHTQAALKDAGVTHVDVARGWSWDQGGVPDWVAGDPPAYAEIPARPISSWSSAVVTAESFAESFSGGVQAVTMARVPAERILSFPRTGDGSLNEREFTVLGGEMPVTVTKVTGLWKTPDELTAAGDFDESKHPRGAGGKFAEVEGDAPDDAALSAALLADIENRGSAVVDDADEVGERLLGLEGIASGGLAEQRLEIEAKVKVAQDLARDMKSSTVDLVNAAYLGIKVGDPNMHLWRDPEGRIRTGWALENPPAGAVRGDDPAAEMLIREKATDVLVAQWAATANDQSELALAIQRAAVEEFGLKDTMEWDTFTATERRTDEIYAEHGDVYRDFLRTQYDHTQAALQEEGIDHLDLARGWTFPRDAPVPEWAIQPEREKPVYEVTVAQRPMASWTSSFATASFFSGLRGATAMARVPAERVLSIPRTGVGALIEREFVVLGGTTPMVVYRSVYGPEIGFAGAPPATFDFDPEKHPRDEKGQFAGSEGTPVSRGISATAEDVPREVADRLVAGTASLDDVLAAIDVAEVGSYWSRLDPTEPFGPSNPDELRQEAEGFAEIAAEETPAKVLGPGGLWEDDDPVSFDLPVVLVGRTENYDPVNDPDSDGETLPEDAVVVLDEIRYNAGNGWVSVDAEGLRVSPGGVPPEKDESRTASGDFDESKHPRGPGGKFEEVEGGGREAQIAAAPAGSIDDARTGEPITIHGFHTTSRLTDLTPEFEEALGRPDVLGPGFYMTDDSSAISAFGGDVQEITVTLLNPYVVETERVDPDDYTDPSDSAIYDDAAGQYPDPEWVESQGYDGIVLRGEPVLGEDQREVVVFPGHDDQIKEPPPEDENRTASGRLAAAFARLDRTQLDALRAVLAVFDADFEEKHPREHGRFVEKEGGDSTDEPSLPKGWRTEEPDGKFAVAYRHQDIVMSLTAAAAERVPIEVQHEVMARLASLRDTDPLGYRLSVDVMNPTEMKTKGAAGETFTSYSGPSVIQLSAARLDPTGLAPLGDNVLKTMPDVSAHEYIVTHEYGHALQNAEDVSRDDLRHQLDRIDIMQAEERPSAYGDIRLTNEHEAYAEAYADWRLNPGEPGPLAKALAEYDGWGSR